MDMILFGSSLSLGLLVGLTLKKHQVYLIPQSLGIAKTNREYFDDMQREQEEQDFNNYYATKNTTRHLNVAQKWSSSHLSCTITALHYLTCFAISHLPALSLPMISHSGWGSCIFVGLWLGQQVCLIGIAIALLNECYNSIMLGWSKTVTMGLRLFIRPLNVMRFSQNNWRDRDEAAEKVYISQQEGTNLST